VTIRLGITNHEPQGGPALLAQTFYVDPAGDVGAQPVESRVVPPGITHLVTLREDRTLVLQAAPEFAPSAAVRRQSRDGEG
jgi:hypothetical protein